MNKYEITFIVRPDLDEAGVKKTFDEMKKVLTDKKATIVEEKSLGQKELAYEINKYRTGYYYFILTESDNKTIKEFDRVARINEKLLRHLIVKVDD